MNALNLTVLVTCLLPFVLLFLFLVLIRHTQENFLKSSFVDTSVALIACVVLIFIAEIVLRTSGYDPWKRYDMYQKDGYYHLVPNGNDQKKIHYERAKLVTEEVDGEPFWYFEGNGWNSFHGRGKEPLKTKPDFRMVWIGNSIVFGSGVDIEDTFAYKTAEKLEEDYAGVESVNLAVPGYNLTNCKIALKRVLPKLPADILILGLWDGGMYNTKLIDGVLYSADVQVIEDQKIINALPFKDEQVAKLARISKLFGLFTTALGILNFDYEKKSVSNTEKILLDLEEIRKLTKSMNIELALLWLPPLDRPFADQLKNPNPKLDEKLIKVVHFQAVKKYATQHSLPLLDLRELLKDLNVEDIRLDPCCHYNQNGHEIIAERLIDWIGQI